MHIVIVGTGRAGSSFAQALASTSHTVRLVRHTELASVGSPDLVLLCVPDDAIADVAGALEVSPDVVVAHVAGSRTLSVLVPHQRTASLHPLCAMSSSEIGAVRLRGAVFCVSGDELVLEVVKDLGGRVITIDDADRTRYHATATIAANHLVALLGEVSKVASSINMQLDDFLPLARQALDDVATLGPRVALTGPASRGDVATIDAHLAALPDEQRRAYVALASAAFELAGTDATLAPRP